MILAIQLNDILQSTPAFILDIHEMKSCMKCLKNFKAQIKGNFFNQGELKYTKTWSAS
jgi:hypothetical protein